MTASDEVPIVLPPLEAANLRAAAAEVAESRAVCAAIVSEILATSRQWSHLLAERRRLAEREAALSARVADLRDLYDLAEGDSIDPATGKITRASAP